jgi:hypothetical protein
MQIRVLLRRKSWERPPVMVVQSAERSNMSHVPVSLPDRMRALFFFPGNFIRRTDGCHVRALQTLALLIAAGLDVTVYSFRNHPQWPWRPADEARFEQIFPTTRLVLDDRSAAFDLSGRLKSAAAFFGPRLRDRALSWHIAGQSPNLAKLDQDRPFDLIVASSGADLTLLNGLKAKKTIIDVHDVPALERIRDGKPGAPNVSVLLELRKQLSLLARADALWCISFAESCFLNEMLDSHNVRFVPPLADTTLTNADEAEEHEFDLLFIGSDNRWNSDALLGFLDDFANWESRFRLAVAGKVSQNPQVRARAEKLDNIVLLGFQDDLAALYRKTRATVCPVEGTGTKIKLIESLAADRPVFAAAGSVRGLAPGYESCVFPLDEASATRVLDDPCALRAAINATRDYKRNYAFDTLLTTIRKDLG